MESIWIIVSTFMHHIELLFKPLMELTGLSVVELHIMASLFSKDGVRASELAASVGKAATSFTPLLDKLEGKGYVRRSPDPTDRRAVLVSLTSIGASMRLEIVEGMKPINRQLAQEMPNWLLFEAPNDDPAALSEQEAQAAYADAQAEAEANDAYEMARDRAEAEEESAYYSQPDEPVEEFSIPF
jgi:DNA-binding MarR family transcriptional regulator